MSNGRNNAAFVAITSVAAALDRKCSLHSSTFLLPLSTFNNDALNNLW